MLLASKPLVGLLLWPPIRRHYLYALSCCHLQHKPCLCCAALQVLL